MTARRFTFASALVACLAFSASFVSAAAARAREGIDRAIAFLFDTLARPTAALPSFGRSALVAGPALAYDGPTIDLRHEARTSRRAAPRNI